LILPRFHALVRETGGTSGGRLAATPRQAAARFGLTTELVTVVPYDLPRRWAAAFHRAGFTGIRHELRHDPRARPSGASLFGPAGPGVHPDGDATPVTARALARAGVQVLDVPPAAQLTILSADRAPEPAPPG